MELFQRTRILHTVAGFDMRPEKIAAARADIPYIFYSEDYDTTLPNPIGGSAIFYDSLVSI